jgi:hypothetical protein
MKTQSSCMNMEYTRVLWPRKVALRRRRVVGGVDDHVIATRLPTDPSTSAHAVFSCLNPSRVFASLSMDPTSVGYYGTLMFLRAKDPEQVVTAYPIDTQTVTIGREPSCDIRLYYPDVSALHCKIVFQDRKVRRLIFSPGLLGLISWRAGFHRRPRTTRSTRG